MSNRKMLINYDPGEECRIAIVDGDRLEELYQERASSESHVGNIYKGRVVSVEPSIQAAFVDFGLERNGFLHISDLHPKYFPGQAKEESERVGKKTPRRDRPPIQKCLKRGQEILVQVLKEGIGTKGPTLTAYLSIPGRFLVMMPDMERLGVSRRAEDDEVRREMRKTLDEIEMPGGFGFILRTAGIGRTKTEIKRDLAYLQRLWKAIDRRMKSSLKVGELYAESDLLIRTLRDVYSADIESVIVDNVSAAKRAQQFLSIASPRAGAQVLVYRDSVPLFHQYGIEPQIEGINSRHVPLPSGGSLVIDSTEALVAIDVNSGKNRESADAEMTAYKTNQEAVDEICRQLRLRDLGGVVVADLIDMRMHKHRRDIEQRFRNLLKDDRARTHLSSISLFGILEMTRQRMRPSLKHSIYMDCPSCEGSGQTKSPESVVLDVMRRLALVLNRRDVARVELTISPDVAFHLLNQKRSHLVRLEQSSKKIVTVRVGGKSLDHVGLVCYDARGAMFDGEAVDKKRKPDIVPVESVEASDEDDGGGGDDLLDLVVEVEEVEETAGSGGDATEQAAAEKEAKPAKSRRRSRGRGGRRSRGSDQEAKVAESATPAEESPEPEPAQQNKQAATKQGAEPGDKAAGGRSRSRRRRGGSGRGKPSESAKSKAGDEKGGSSKGAERSNPGSSGQPQRRSTEGGSSARDGASGGGDRKTPEVSRGYHNKHGVSGSAEPGNEAAGSKPSGSGGDGGTMAASPGQPSEQGVTA